MPQQPLVETGSTVDFNCTIPDNLLDRLDSSKLTMHFGKNDSGEVSVSVPNGRTMALRIANIQRSGSDHTVFCSSNVTDLNGLPIHTSTVVKVAGWKICQISPFPSPHALRGYSMYQTTDMRRFYYVC